MQRHADARRALGRDALTRAASRHAVLFDDRLDAANRLAESLDKYRGQHPLVLGIPRGGVPMARLIAQRLRGDLDVVLVRKLRAPFSPEVAIGAIDESGWTYLSPLAEAAGADASYIASEKAAQLDTLERRRARYTPTRTPCDPAGRLVIIVDDGLATGATMIAALHAVRARRAAKIVCAVPVAAPDSLAAVRRSADEVVCLHAPADFDAVGRYYRQFSAVSDDTVVTLLSTAQDVH